MIYRPWMATPTILKANQNKQRSFVNNIFSVVVTSNLHLLVRKFFSLLLSLKEKKYFMEYAFCTYELNLVYGLWINDISSVKFSFKKKISPDISFSRKAVQLSLEPRGSLVTKFNKTTTRHLNQTKPNIFRVLVHFWSLVLNQSTNFKIHKVNSLVPFDNRLVNRKNQN